MIPLVFRSARVLREAVRGFLQHKAPRLGAALAYYTLLSLSPLLLIVLTILGPMFGADAARGALSGQIEGLVGVEGGKAIEAMVSDANRPHQGIIPMLIGLAVLFFGASGVFVELKDTLDDIWEMPEEQRKGGLGLRSLAFDRLLALTLIGVMAFLLLVSLVLSAVFTAIGERLFGSSELELRLANLANIGISFLITTCLFAMIFRLLPARRTPWRHVLTGAVVTSLLFFLGKSLIGLYLGRAAVGSAYGAAGSLVVLLVWVYYSTQILLFGAEVTRAMSPPVTPSVGSTEAIAAAPADRSV